MFPKAELAYFGRKMREYMFTKNYLSNSQAWFVHKGFCVRRQSRTTIGQLASQIHIHLASTGPKAHYRLVCT